MKGLRVALVAVLGLVAGVPLHVLWKYSGDDTDPRPPVPFACTAIGDATRATLVPDARIRERTLDRNVSRCRFLTPGPGSLASRTLTVEIQRSAPTPKVRFHNRHTGAEVAERRFTDLRAEAEKAHDDSVAASRLAGLGDEAVLVVSSQRGVGGSAIGAGTTGVGLVRRGDVIVRITYWVATVGVSATVRAGADAATRDVLRALD